NREREDGCPLGCLTDKARQVVWPKVCIGNLPSLPNQTERALKIAAAWRRHDECQKTTRSIRLLVRLRLQTCGSHISPPPYRCPIARPGNVQIPGYEIKLRITDADSFLSCIVNTPVPSCQVPIRGC